MARATVVHRVEKAVSEVCPDYDVVAAYLYGSYARNEEHEESDVDVAVLFEEYRMRTLLELGRRLQEEAGIDREIDVRPLNGKDLVFQRNVLKDAELLYEGDEEERKAFERSVYNRYLDMKPHIEEYRGKRRERVAEAVA